MEKKRFDRVKKRFDMAEWLIPGRCTTGPSYNDYGQRAAENQAGPIFEVVCPVCGGGCYFEAKQKPRKMVGLETTEKSGRTGDWNSEEDGVAIAFTCYGCGHKSYLCLGNDGCTSLLFVAWAWPTVSRG
jgi:hypothetical protein